MRRHTFDPISFLFGLVFVGVAAFVMFGSFGVPSIDARWLAPAAILAAGVLLLGSALGRSNAERRREDTRHIDNDQ